MCCGERCDSVCESFLNEVITQVHEVFGTYGYCHVKRPSPIAIGNHFEHHEVVFVECVLTSQGDYHTVGYRIARNHHSASAHSVLIDCHEDSVGGNHVRIGVL